MKKTETKKKTKNAVPSSFLFRNEDHPMVEVPLHFLKESNCEGLSVNPSCSFIAKPYEWEDGTHGCVVYEEDDDSSIPLRGVTSVEFNLWWHGVKKEYTQ